MTDDLLSDMVWTASVGRSHFGYRRGVVFQDTDSLRNELNVIANIDADPETPEPIAASKVAFVYADEIGYRPDVVRELYESEPVFRSVIDRCDETLGAEQGVRLLDVMLGRSELDNSGTDTKWARRGAYALQCALTALWTNAGVTPNEVLARGIGELAASQAAGELSLEDGLRMRNKAGNRSRMISPRLSIRSLKNRNTSSSESGRVLNTTCIRLLKERQVSSIAWLERMRQG